MILIFAELNDVHALAVWSCVTKRLRKEALILNVSEYPTRWRIDFFAGTRNEYRIKVDGSSYISSADVEGVWRRRIQTPVIHESISQPEIRSFCQREARDFALGFLGTLDNVVNSEKAEYLAGKKAYQLRVAAQVGLNIPDTLISSDPAEIIEFYEQHHGQIVFKILTATQFQFTETRMLLSEQLNFVDSAIFAPTIFQRKIQPRMHIRSTVVDAEIYSASIKSTKEYSLWDWRLDPDPLIKPINIPPEVAKSLVNLMQVLGLRYGAIDLILGEDGLYYFLEVNPSGQFLFVEIQTGQPISLAIAKAISLG